MHRQFRFIELGREKLTRKIRDKLRYKPVVRGSKGSRSSNPLPFALASLPTKSIICTKHVRGSTVLLWNISLQGYDLRLSAVEKQEADNWLQRRIPYLTPEKKSGICLNEWGRTIQCANLLSRNKVPRFLEHSPTSFQFGLAPRIVWTAPPPTALSFISLGHLRQLFFLFVPIWVNGIQKTTESYKSHF